jgi:hypothetical protein
MLLQRHRAGAIEQPGLDDYIKSELSSAPEITAEVIRRAMELDLTTLADGARRRYHNIRNAAGRVVVLIDDVYTFSSPASTLRELLDLLDPSGLGSTNQHVPVVIMASLGGFADQELRHYIDGSLGMAWLRIAELTPFSETDGEDMLVCEQVWLHPFRMSQPYQLVVNHDDPASFETLAALCRDALNGLPRELVGDRFEVLTKAANRFKLLNEIDDDKLLLLAKPEH